MARSKAYASFSAVCMTIIFIATLSGSQAGVEETLAELNAKPAEERNKVLLENARKEGTATVYTATNIRDTQEILAGFNKIYPFVKVAFSSLGGPGVLNKILTEYRAGVHLADIVVLNGINAVELIDKKIAARYRSSMVPFLRKGFVDPEGYWPGVYFIGYTVIYNNKRVSPRSPSLPNLTGYRRSRELSLLKASVFCRTPRRAHCPTQDYRSEKNT